MKNLHCLSEFLSFLATAQNQLQALQLQLHKVCPNPNQLYRGLCRSNTVQLSRTDLEFFVKSFGFDLYRSEIGGSNYKILRKPANKEKLLGEGVTLLLRQYGSQDSMTFDDFCWLSFGNNEPGMSTSSRNSFEAKEALFNLLQAEIQNLIDIQNFKKIVVEETPNLEEAFKLITKNRLTLESIEKLLSVNGIFLGESTAKILLRLKGDLSVSEFVKYFKTPAAAQQTKIFQSSIKKRDLHQSNLSFGTPVKKNYLTQASTSRRQQKTVLSQVKVKELKDQHSEPQRFKILQEIVTLQSNFEKKRQNLILQRNLDLELAYETLIDEFQPVLRQVYKDTSFTSFLRFVFPATTWQHQYLGFIRYNIDNKISQSNLDKLRQVKKDYDQKESRIAELWREVEAQGSSKELFKSISSDALGIYRQDLAKYLPEKSVKLLMGRMDRLGSGRIILAWFK